jgi:hypothetical protein
MYEMVATTSGGILRSCEAISSNISTAERISASMSVVSAASRTGIGSTLCQQIRLVRFERDEARPLQPAKHNPHRVVGRVDGLQNLGDHSHLKQIAQRRLVDGHIALGHQQHQFVERLQRRFDGVERLLAPHEHGRERVGKVDIIAHGQNR